MKKLMLLILFSIPFVTNAAEPLYESPKRDSLFYYRVGGGKPFTSLPRLQVTTINLTLGASLTGFHCGKLDPKVSLKNALNRAKDGLDDMMIQLQNAATAAIANLPGYLLMKFNPDLYEALMSSIAQANFSFSLATKNCSQMAAEIAAGGDPYEKFAQISVGDKWKVGLGTSGVDAVDLQESSSNSNDGFIWVGGNRAGGDGLPKAKPASDAAKAGYNMLLGRPVTDDSNPAATLSDQPIVLRFSNPAELETWVEDVLGDDEICVNDGCQSGSKPGTGLWSVLQSKKDEVWPQLQGLYAGTINPTPENLILASAPGTNVTAQLIRSLQALDPGDAEILAGRLLNEIALARTIDEALLVKRALNSGYRESNIAKNGMAMDMILERIKMLESEMKNLMGEMRLREETVSKTAQEILIMEKSFRDKAKTRRIEQSGEEKELYRGEREDG